MSGRGGGGQRFVDQDKALRPVGARSMASSRRCSRRGSIASASGAGEARIDSHLTQKLESARELRFHQRLGRRRCVERHRQFLRPARAHAGQHEAARRRGASVAEAARRRGLAQPGGGHRCASRARATCASGMRQRRDLGAGIAARQRASTACRRHGAGPGRKSSSVRSRISRCSLAMCVRGRRAARWQSLVRPHRGGPESQRWHASMESGAGCLAGHPGRQSARGPARATLASGTSTASRTQRRRRGVRSARRFVARRNGNRARRLKPRSSASPTELQRLLLAARSRPCQRFARRRALSPAHFAQRPAAWIYPAQKPSRRRPFSCSTE